MKINIELETTEENNALFLHEEIGKGTYGKKEVRFLLEAGRRCLIVEENTGKGKWISHIITIEQLAEKLIKALVK